MLRLFRNSILLEYRKSRFLTVVSNMGCPKPRHLGQDMVIWWSLASVVGISQPIEYACYRSLENFMSFKRSPSIHKKWRAWHVVPRTRIIGHIFFHTTNNFNVYTDIFQDFVNLLDDRELTGHFEQYGEMCHASNQPSKKSGVFLRTGFTRNNSGMPSLQTWLRLFVFYCWLPGKK